MSNSDVEYVIETDGSINVYEDFIKPRKKQFYAKKAYRFRKSSFANSIHHDRFLENNMMRYAGIKRRGDTYKAAQVIKEHYAPLEEAISTKNVIRESISDIYDKTDGFYPEPMRMEYTMQQESTNTTYVRASNDYTMSPHQDHQRWAKDLPTTTSVVAITNMPYTEMDNLITFISGVLADENQGLALVSDTHVEFYDDPEDGDNRNDDYSLYKQRCMIWHNIDGRTITFEILSGNKSSSITVFKSVNVESHIVEKIIENKSRFKTFVEHKKEATFYTISQNARGFSLEDLEIRKRMDSEDILNNYNDDFADAHAVINACIDEDKRGLILLHGIPGSGKTSYIKHLITKSGKRKIVYIPPHLAASIASPHFISFVKSELSDSVLVIEDAEQILLSRESVESHKEAVSNILNMTDGILADALNILIICTFNTDMANIDSALRRKGRMMLQYKFEELSVEKTNALTERMYGKKVNKALPLSEIFNLEYELITPAEKPKVSFGFGPAR